MVLGYAWLLSVASYVGSQRGLVLKGPLPKGPGQKRIGLTIMD